MTKSSKSRQPSPATAFSMALTMSTVPFIVRAPTPYAAPATPNTTAMKTINPFMNGETPTRAPVSGLLSGAPGGNDNSAKNASVPMSAQKEYFRPRVSCSEKPADADTGGASSGGTYLPRRGSTTLSVMSDTTIVCSNTAATENQRFDVNEIDRLGLVM